MKWNNLHPLVRLVLIVMPIMFLCLCCCSIVLIVTPTKDSDKKSNGQTQEEAESQEDVKEEVKGEVIQLYKVTQVVDGDTLKLEIDGREETVRLVGIDTPESVDPRKPVQCFAVEASNKLKELVSGKNVLFEYDTKQGHTDKYGRLLLYIWLPQSDGSKLFINEYMIKEGYAYAYRQIESEYLNEFIDFEEQARVGNKGLWGNVCECKDRKDQEKSRSCVECKKAEVEYYNWDCSTYKKVVDDSSCSGKCPKPVSSITTKPATKPSSPVSKYTCNCKKTCPNLSCEEAQYQLNECGCEARDADDDGIACDTKCQ